MNQKDAVFEAVKTIKPQEIEKKEPVTLSKQEKALVQDRLFEGFKKRRIDYNGELPSDDALAQYVSGLVSNWIRKDRRLNGDVKYQAQRPGSRSGLSRSPPQNNGGVTLSVPENVTPEVRKQLEQLAAAMGGTAILVVRQQDSSEDADASAAPNGAQH